MASKGESYRALRDLLLDSFTLSELEQFLTLNDYGFVPDDVSPNLGATKFSFDVVKALDRTGHLNARLFDHLVRERPAKRETIISVGRTVLGKYEPPSVLPTRGLDKPVLTLRGHQEPINRIAWSRSGGKLASASDDCTVRAWDATKGKLLWTHQGEDKAVSIAWSPGERRVACGYGDGRIRIWKSDAKYRTLRGHANTVHSLAWSPDGSMLASGSSDNEIRIWRTDTWDMPQVHKEHADYVYSVSWSPDGQLLASGSFDRMILLWDAGVTTVTRRLPGHEREVLCVAWSPDGSMLASSSFDGMIRIWSIKQRGKRTILEGHAGSVRSVAFSGDGRLLASKSEDGWVRLWRCDTWDNVAEIREPASNAWAASLAFHPEDPAVLATLGEADSVIRIWRLDLERLLGR